MRRQIEAANAAESQADAIEVYPENIPAYVLFCEMRTCWKVHGMSGMYLGLDYTHLPYFEAWRDADDRGEIERKLRLLERAALDQWAEDRES